MIEVPDSVRWAVIRRNALDGHARTARALGITVDEVARVCAGIPVCKRTARALLGKELVK